MPGRVKELMLVTLDTSCVINLLDVRESPDPGVIELVRAGLEGRVRLHVTEVVGHEIPKTDAKAHLRSRVAALPVLDVHPTRSGDLEFLSAALFNEMWPNAVPGSQSSDHGRRDARHLAAHVLCGGTIFVTLDRDVLRKAPNAQSFAGHTVATPQEAAARVAAARPAAVVDSNLEDVVVRRAERSDASAIGALMEPIRHLYPNFDEWRASALQSKQCFVGCVEGRVAAVAVWSAKAAGVVKLSTFYVRDEDRGAAMGPHLLFHQLRFWARGGITKVYVTVSSRVRHVVPFFLRFGFRIEGAAPRRYGTDDVEIVLAKHFVHEQVDDVAAWRNRYREMLVGTPELFDVAPDDWFMAPAAQEARHAQFDRLTVPDLEKIFFPVRLTLPSRKAYLVPIRPKWADRMVQYRKRQGELFFGPETLVLRTENAYYCHPRYGAEKLAGEHVLFYVSGDSVVIGAARVLACEIDTPEALYLRFGGLGIYRLEQIREHARSSSGHEQKAMALQFGWWLPFERPVELERLRELGLSHPQTITAMDFHDFLRVCGEGEEKI